MVGDGDIVVVGDGAIVVDGDGDIVVVGAGDTVVDRSSSHPTWNAPGHLPSF